MQRILLKKKKATEPSTKDPSIIMWQTVGQGDCFIIMILYSLEDYHKLPAQ